MRPLLLLFVLATCCLGADAAALSAKGFKVTEKNGVITGLNGSTKGFTADDFKAIAAVTTLTQLSLDGGEVNDENLTRLAGLSALQTMSFNATSFSDDGCKVFAGFPKLKSLALFHPSRSNPAFTGAGLAHLAALPEFESLTLAGANVGDPALTAIATLPRLKSLRLWHNIETADGLKALSSMTSLRKLTLGQRLAGRPAKPASLSDASLPSIAKITGLEELTLQEARLSGDALMKLRDLPNLKKLTVSQVDTPAADVEKLKAALPKVTIDWKPLTEEQAKTLTEKLKL
ncbi:MAG: hypothetical protein H0W78_02240 [Planctomycetes bacterium]|nr:hypothetical protein [Planctomycetota bacterium]